MIVVIPTNRSIDLAALSPLIESGARFIVVDDSEGSITLDHPSFEVHTWADRRKRLGALDVAIPKRNGACRDFGFLVAWQESDDDEIIVALDDDCFVYHEDFGEQVEAALSTTPRPVARTHGRHLNILALYRDVSEALYPRGFPYSARAGDTRVSIDAAEAHDVKFSLGLWKGAFDVNAVDKVNGPEWQHPDAALAHDSVVIGDGHLISVCSMNMQFRREVLPAAYQLPMHIAAMPNWVIDRYGDIWGGFILKMLMDKRGDAMAVGEPMIRHLKAGDHQRNIWQEHVCHLVNDEFIELMLAASDPITPTSYVEMMAELGENVRRLRAGCSPLLGTYVDHLTTALAAWTTALRK